MHKRFTRYPLNKAVMSQLWLKISAALIGEAAKDKEQLSMSPLYDIRDKLMLWFGPPDVFQGMVRAMMQRRSPGVALYSWLQRHRTIFEFLQTSPVALLDFAGGSVGGFCRARRRATGQQPDAQPGSERLERSHALVVVRDSACGPREGGERRTRHRCGVPRQVTCADATSAVDAGGDLDHSGRQEGLSDLSPSTL